MAAYSGFPEESYDSVFIILDKMDKEEVSLEESFQLYNDGLKIVKDLNDKLDDAQERLTVVNQ